MPVQDTVPARPGWGPAMGSHCSPRSVRAERAPGDPAQGAGAEPASPLPLCSAPRRAWRPCHSARQPRGRLVLPGTGAGKTAKAAAKLILVTKPNEAPAGNIDTKIFPAVLSAGHATPGTLCSVLVPAVEKAVARLDRVQKRTTKMIQGWGSRPMWRS